MTIRLRRVSKITETVVSEEGYVAINCLSWFTSNTVTYGEQKLPLYQLSPYHLNDRGMLFENIWQGSKVYPNVTTQKQPADKGDWQHPAEVHVDAEGKLTPEYWAWRVKLLQHPHPVRYPNGYHGRHKCVCSVWSKDGASLEVLNYVQARQTIYVSEYVRLVKQTSVYKQLQELMQTYKLELLDLDCPPSIEVTRQVYDKYLHNTNERFGHTWALAGALLGWF